MTTAEILRKAKAEMERRGFCQGDFTDDQGRCCLLGACWYAMGATFRKTPGNRRQWQVIRGSRDFPGGVVSLLDSATGQTCHEWNDTPGRTAAETIAVFDRAIALAEASETPKEGTP